VNPTEGTANPIEPESIVPFPGVVHCGEFIVVRGV